MQRLTGLSVRGLRQRLQETLQITISLQTIHRILKATRLANISGGSQLRSDPITSLENLCLELLSIGRPAAIISSLVPETTQRIVTIIRTGTVRERKRAALVALQAMGETRTKSARLVGSCRASAKKYWDLFQSCGIGFVLNPSRSASKVDDQCVRSNVFRVLHTPPRTYGFNRTTWRLKDLNIALRREGTPVSRDVISSIIRSAGYQYKKARKVLTSNDPDYRAKLERIQHILSGLAKEERFFSIDEFGPVSIKLQPGKRLVGPGECPTIPQYQQSKGRVLMIGALELSTNQLTHFYAERKSTGEMIRLIDVLIEQ